jgi:hypothetical protein
MKILHDTLISELIGQKFSRNKYGESSWVDEITDVFYIKSGSFETRKWRVEPYVRGKRGQVYELNEIIIKD